MISTELGILTYLQSLLKYDNTGNVICDAALNCYREECDFYLWEKQFETVKKFKALLQKSDFAIPNK